MSRNKNKRKGQAKFVMIDGYIWRTAAWQALSGDDKASYLELKWRYDGLNNGRIGLGCRELADAIHVSKDTALRSLKSLVEKGFVAKAKASGFNVKNRTATEWRLTEYKCDVTGELPTKEFTRWDSQEKAQARHRDTQAHHRDSRPLKRGENSTDRRTTGTVKPISNVPQAHHRDTYSTTRGEDADAA